MATQLSILASGVATGMAWDAQEKAHREKSRVQQQQKRTLQRKKEATLASNRARQYASGIGGKSAENIRDDMRSHYDHAIGNVAGAGDNTMGKINLLAKSVRKWGRL